MESASISNRSMFACCCEAETLGNTIVDLAVETEEKKCIAIIHPVKLASDQHVVPEAANVPPETAKSPAPEPAKYETPEPATCEALAPESAKHVPAPVEASVEEDARPMSKENWVPSDVYPLITVRSLWHPFVVFGCAFAVVRSGLRAWLVLQVLDDEEGLIIQDEEGRNSVQYVASYFATSLFLLYALPAVGWVMALVHGGVNPRRLTIAYASASAVACGIGGLAFDNTGLFGAMFLVLVLACVVLMFIPGQRSFAVTVIATIFTMVLIATFAGRILPVVTKSTPQVLTPFIFPAGAALFKILTPSIFKRLWKTSRGDTSLWVVPIVLSVVMAYGDMLFVFGLLVGVVQSGTQLEGFTQGMQAVAAGFAFKIFNRCIGSPGMLLGFWCGKISHNAFYDYVLRYSVVRTYSPLNVVPFAGCGMWAFLSDGAARKWAVWLLLVAAWGADVLADVVVMKVHQRRYASRTGVAPCLQEMWARLQEQGGHFPLVPGPPEDHHFVRDIPKHPKGSKPTPADHTFGVPPNAWAAAAAVILAASSMSGWCERIVMCEVRGLPYPT